MLEVFVLCNRGTKQLMTKGIQLPDNYSGTDEDGIESFQKWGKVLFYKTYNGNALKVASKQKLYFLPQIV